MYLSEIARMLQGMLHGKDTRFQGVSIDTRTIQPQQLFIAIKGAQVDGHDFLALAEEKGAAGALVTQVQESNLPQVLVSDVRMALGEIASYYRRQLHMPIIALTGSCGKTTTKGLITSILSQYATVHATQGTLNNDYGMPLTLLGASQNDAYVVLEMGANHPHEISYLTHIARPTIALITNAGPVHLEGFGSIDGVATSKGEIFQGLTENGIAIINLADSFADYWLQLCAGHPYITFGLNEKADVYATDIALNEQGAVSFTLHTLSGVTPVQMSLIGEHNVVNALAAAAVGLAAGASLAQIQHGLERTESADKRLVAQRGKEGAYIIDDSYNANPVAMEMALKLLANYVGEKIFVIGDMAELGTDAEWYHQQLGQKAKHYGIDRLYAVGDLSRAAAIAFGENAEHFSDQKTLAIALQQKLGPDVTILVKGSRSSKMENIVAKLMDVK